MTPDDEDAELFADYGTFVAEGGWQLLSPPPCDGLTDIVTAARSYPDDTVEVITIQGADHARFRRDNPEGLLVWIVDGDLRDVMKAARDLPLPGHPDAPSEPIRDTAEGVGHDF